MLLLRPNWFHHHLGFSNLCYVKGRALVRKYIQSEFASSCVLSMEISALLNCQNFTYTCCWDPVQMFTWIPSFFFFLPLQKRKNLTNFGIRTLCFYCLPFSCMTDSHVKPFKANLSMIYRFSYMQDEWC